jgi:TolB-like protein/Tfp pilus assembly protein PilF
MRALAEMGERAQALREFVRCREALKKSLDVEPSTETLALHEAIRAFAGREERDKAPTPAAQASQPASVGQEPLPARSRLRVGVLPFVGSRSVKEDNLAFSLSQEIAAALARFRWFDVIAPTSLMRKPMAGAVSDEQLQRKELDYVVDGALSANGKQFQISVRLLDLSQYARPVWNDRFELAVGELHRLNEMVTTKIVGRIDPVILFIEGQPKRRERYGATGLILLAIPLIYSLERSKFEEAATLINQALEIEPDNAMVIAYAAHWHLIHVAQGWSTDKNALMTAEALCVQAIKLDPENAEALGIYGHICAWKKDFEGALFHYDRALRLNPSLAFSWAMSAATFCYIGEPDVALQRLERYRELAPFDPYYRVFESIYTTAYTMKGQYEHAVAIGRRVVTFNPDFGNGYKPLIAALGHLGRCDEARPYVDKLLKLEPTFSLKQFSAVYPLKRASDRNRFVAGLRLAGVPEG